MAISLGNLVSGLVNGAQSLGSTVEQAVENAPENVKQTVGNLVGQADEFVSNVGQNLNAQVGQTTSLPKLDTPAKVKAEYQQDAKKDLTNAGTLKQLNQELKARDPNAPPLTSAEVQRVIDNADVKSLSESDYRTLKMAVPGSQPGNPASSMDSANRAKLAKDGPENLARARLQSQGSKADPTPEQISQAEADLRRIDPGAFQNPPKDVVYVNQKHIEHNGDPRQTKVAAHEFTHLVLDHRGVPDKDPDGTDPQHAIIGRLGWNQTYGTSGKVIGGETDNWATKPGDGDPKP